MRKAFEHVQWTKDGMKDDFAQVQSWEENEKFIYEDNGGKWETSELIDLDDVEVDEESGAAYYHGKELDDYIIDEL